MPRTKGMTTKNVYIEVPDVLWGEIKVHCFRTKQTLKKFVTGLIEEALNDAISKATKRTK